MADDVRRHAAWIAIKNWADHKDTRTGLRHSSLGEVADFAGIIQERTEGGDWRHPKHVFDWEISRQRTEREGPDERGLHWAPRLAADTAGTMPEAKRNATAAMKALRTQHILEGGDVGYGDAPTGDQIRASIEERGALETGQSMITGRGEHDGVAWERVVSRPAGVIGAIASYRLTYDGRQLDTAAKGRTAEEAAGQWREQVEQVRARQQAQEKPADPPAAMTGTSYDVDAVAARLGTVGARYRSSAAIHHVTGIDSGAASKYAPMVALYNALKDGLVDPDEMARWQLAEGFSQESVAGQADRAEAIAQVLERIEHDDADVRQWMPEHPAEVARAAAGLHEYARAAREALSEPAAAKPAEAGSPAQSTPPPAVQEPRKPVMPAWGWGRPQNVRTEDYAAAARGAVARDDYAAANRWLDKADAAEAHEGVGAGEGSRGWLDHERQTYKIREAGQANARGMDRMSARSKAGAIHFREATGMTLPHPADLHPGHLGPVNQAMDHFGAGRYDEGLASLDQAIAEDQAIRLGMGKLEAFRARAAKAAASAKPTLPALARLPGGTDKGFTALGHQGAEYQVGLHDGTVTVTTEAGTLSGPAGDNPTAAVRELAGQLARQAEAEPAEMEAGA